MLHYRNLQLYLRQGMRLKTVHRVLEFDQEPWMEPYIRMNTEFRKQAKNDFETDFFKLMNNSVFAKTMENKRSRVDVRIVRKWEDDKVRKLISDPSFSSFTLFSNDIAGVHMHKRRLSSRVSCCGLVNLPESLPHQPHFGGVFRNFCGLG